MVEIRTLQKKLHGFIDHGDPSELLVHLDGDVAQAVDRLNIFRNNSLVTHTKALTTVFPVVCQLVDARFFAYMAHAFLRTKPATHPCLSEFGSEFPAFVAAFAPASSIHYLADVARLEWALSRVPTEPSGRPIPLAELATRSGNPALARLTIDPSVHFVRSAYPIDIIWELNRTGNLIEDTQLDSRGAYLQVHGFRSPPWRNLARADWTFRHWVARGKALGDAAATTLDAEPDFNLPSALAALFSEGLVLACN